MTTIQISEICIKKGESVSVPDALNEAEMAFAVDTGDVIIGAPNLNALSWRRQGKTYEQYPYGNLRLLTELDYAKLISGDVALNTPLQNFNLPSTAGKTVDIGTTTSNPVPISPENPMPMFYLPPGANTAKMDLSIVNSTDSSISIVSLLITGWGTSSSNAKCNIVVNPESNLPSGLTFYATMNFTSETDENSSTTTTTTTVPDMTIVPESESTSETIQQIVLGYVNSSSNTYTVYSTFVCWNSSVDGSAPIPGLSGIAAQSNVYANSNVINPAGTQGPAGKDGKSFPNDGTTPVNASTVSGTTATFTNLNVTGNISIPGLSTSPSTLISSNTNISNITLPPTIIATNNSSFDFTEPVLFNNGNDGYYVPTTGWLFDTPISFTGSNTISFGLSSTISIASSNGIRFAASSSNSSKYYSIAYDSTINGLNITSPSDGMLYTSGAVHFAGQTTLDNLIVKDLNTNYITIESAQADIETSTVNGVTEITTTVSGTGSIIGWELATGEYYTYFVNMYPSGNPAGFRFLADSGSKTLQTTEYIVEIDSSGNIETKGGLLLGEGSTLTFSNESGTGTVILGYDEKQEAVTVTATGIVDGAFIFPNNITARSLSTTSILPISDYSGNVPSTQWVKNYVESTKIDFTNDGTSDIYADNGSFSSLQVNGLTTLQNATAVTPIITDNSNNIATTAFVQENIQNYISNVSLLGYVTKDDIANSYVSGKYGMSTTDYRVASLYYSNEENAPVLIYKDSTNSDQPLTLIDTVYASNNLVTLAYIKTLFPNDGTSSGDFLSITAGTLKITSSASLATATATTPSLSDVSNRVATCAYVSGQNYVSGSYGVPAGIQTYNGQGLYFDITKSTPVFVYSDSNGKQQNVPIITKSYADTNYVSSSSISNTLSGYVKTSQLQQYITASDLSDYVTTDTLAGYLKITDANSTFAKNTDLDVYLKTSTAESTYVTSADFVNQLSNYAKTTDLSSYLTTTVAATTYATIDYVNQKQSSSNFVTKSDLQPYALTANVASMSNVEDYLTTNGYVTSGSLSSYLKITDAASTYVTLTNLNSTLSNYYTASKCDTRYVIGLTQSSSLDSVTSIAYDPTNNYFTISYEDSTTATVNTKNIVDKTYVDNGFVKKSTILPTSYVPWSAVVAFGSVNATITINDSGFYIVGCICYVWLNATITNLGTGTGNMTIGNLPTNATGTYNFPLNVSISKIYSTTLTAYVSNNSISVMGTNGITTSNITNTNITVGANVVLSGSYPISLT